MSAPTSVAPPEALRPWSDRIGEATLYALCLTAFSVPAGAEAATILLVLAFLSVAPRARVLVREPVTLLALAAAGYALLHTLVWGMLSPGQLDLYLGGLGDWLRLLLFVPFAFFSRGDERKLDLLLLLTLCGLLLGMLMRLDWAMLIDDAGAFRDSRPGFGLPALAFAFYSGAGLIGLVTIGRRLPRPAPGGTRRHPLTVVLWALAAGLLLAALSVTAARSGWLALLLAMPVALWIFRGRRAGVAARAKGRWWWKASAGLLVAALVVAGSYRTFERAAWEMRALATRTAGGEPVALTSDAVRWHGLLFGTESWLQRPLFGWGADVSGQLLAASGRDELRSREGVWLEHLHNTYLEILVQFGAVGLILTSAFLLVFAHRLWGYCRAGLIPRAYCGFFAGILVLMVVWSLFEYRVPHRDWRVFWMILAGSAYGFVLRQLPGMGWVNGSPSEDTPTAAYPGGQHPGDPGAPPTHRRPQAGRVPS